MCQNGTGNQIRSCTIITTNANALVAPIHDRMPAIIAPENFAQWLAPNLAPALALLKPFDPSRMETYPVNPLVNTAATDSKDCIAPEIRAGELF